MSIEAGDVQKLLCLFVLEYFKPLGESCFYPTLAKVPEQEERYSRATPAVDNNLSEKA